MTYSVEHVYVDATGATRIETHNGVTSAHYSASGDLPIRHPGRFNIFVQAIYWIHISPGDIEFSPGTGQGSGHGGRPPPPSEEKIPLTTQIFTPDGQLFAADHVTLADLERFRDLREVSQGNWRYQISGASGPIPVSSEDGSRATSGDAIVLIALEETVTSRSAGSLVSTSGGTAASHIFTFDLYRVGQFIAKVTLFGGILSPTARLWLIDPDGAVVASANGGGLLSFPVTLLTLEKSRDANGHIRPWKLEVMTAGPNSGESITATVIASTRVPISILRDRINDLLGAHGSNLSIFGQNKDGRALGRLEILDEFSAETIDMYGLLEKVLAKYPQDSGVDTNAIQKGVVYTIANRSEDAGYDLTLNVGGVRVTGIDITIGPSQHLSPVVPALTVTVAVSGEITLDLAGFSLVSVSVSDGSLALEAGLALDNSGVITLQSWIKDDPLDIDIDWTGAIIAGVLTGALGLLGLEGLTGYVQSEVNDKIVDGFRSLIEDAMLSAPKIMAMLLGADFTITALGVDSTQIAIDYYAPVEPDPKPNPAFMGIIGRNVIELGPDVWQVTPRSLGDTWAADNLAKIDHIVVVEMENRSFDHVLGYREQMEDPGTYGDLIEFLYEQGYPVTWLKNSGILANAAGLKTRFPASVGHRLADVAQQLATQLATPSGTSVNDPQGFLDNFASRVTDRLQVTDIPRHL